MQITPENHAWLLFMAAVIALFLGHLLRAIRWRLMLNYTHIHVTNLQPLIALSVGYIVSTLIPFRLGELVRGIYLGHVAKEDLMKVFASIAFERTLDLLFVAMISACFYNMHENVELVWMPAVIGVLAIIMAIAINQSRTAKRLIWYVASIFNPRIKFALLNFTQTFSDFWMSRSLIFSTGFWALSIIMWGTYLLSLWLFLFAYGGSLSELFSYIYFAPSERAAVSPWIFNASQREWLVLAYLSLPLILIVIYASLSGFKILSRFRQALRWSTNVNNFGIAPSDYSANKFYMADHYGAFLDRKFRADNSLLLDFEERGIGDGLLHRTFHGGSGAITALIEVSGQLVVRKFATGVAGEKLKIQKNWIENHAQDLPLVLILGHDSIGKDHYYDMEFIAGTPDLYEAIHSIPPPASSVILKDVIHRIDGFHRDHKTSEATPGIVRAYLENKVRKNFLTIQDALPEFFESDSIEINKHSFSMRSLNIFDSLDWIDAKLQQRRQSVIHGDLTIENILIMPGAVPPKWLLIDPNPDNGFQSPLIDFSKLMQSLHLGYEAIHRAPQYDFANGRLSVGIHRSEQYHQLYELLIDELNNLYGEDDTKQVMLHEMINYLRLIPYQLQKSHEAGATFFGCLCLLVHDYQKRYPGDMP